MIRIDQIRLAVEPMDMRAAAETALARVVKVFGAAHPHHAYLFANRRANRLVATRIGSGLDVARPAIRPNLHVPEPSYGWPAGSRRDRRGAAVPHRRP